jgi:outer membrane receptor protein involved in Fe transport
MFRDQALLLSLEINNVFNKKVPVGGEDAEFEIGRQFWAGAEYLF